MAHHTKTVNGYNGYKYSLKRPNSTTPTSIVLRTSFNQRGFKFGIGKSIYPELWNKEKYRPTTDKKTIAKYAKLNPNIATDLKNIITRIENIDRDISDYAATTEKNRKQFDIQELKKILEVNKKVKDKAAPKEAEIFLLPYLVATIAGMKSGKVLISSGKSNGLRYKGSTIQNYQSLSVQWTKYEKYKGGKKYRFSDIDMNVYDDLIQFFNSQDLKLNTVGKYVRYLKSLIGMAYDKGIHNNRIHQNKSFATVSNEVDSIALSQTDIDRLQAVNLSEHPLYQLALDVFLIGIYTALRYSDYKRIKPSHIKEIQDNVERTRVIDITTTKTGQRVKIPIRPQLETLLKKYDYKVPKTYEQKINHNIKEVARMANMIEPIPVEQYKGGAKFIKHIPKADMITTHTARRTGITLMYNSGIPVEYIMKISTHQTEKSFRKYLKISADEAATKMADMEYFKGETGKIVNI